ncbi:epoxyqueuosine reductase [Puteibacter caeruleilacunae]|nr:epoxyqueuosine reductase [Puteibacter caeruleilacunae]
MTFEELAQKLKQKLAEQAVSFFRFVDISQLSPKQNKGYPSAILFGIALTTGYLKEVASNLNYVKDMVANKQVKSDEFYLAEIKTDRIADEIAEYLTKLGYKAYSQSEDNVSQTGYYNQEQKTTPLPHKTIAGLAGLGWIGKHNLLVTPEYGSAISMCSVLTNAPLESVSLQPIISRCGDCQKCKDICVPNALKGNNWELGCSREDIVDVFKCTTCFNCVVHCPWTQKYIKKHKK